MTVSAATRLTRLIALYWLGGVTLEVAAKESGLRKASFADLADFRMTEAALQREASRYLSGAFHRLFPECDAEAVRVGYMARRSPATNSSEGKAAKRADIELLTPPHRRTMRELVPRQLKPDAEVAAILNARRSALWKQFVEPEPDAVAELELRFHG